MPELTTFEFNPKTDPKDKIQVEVGDSKQPEFYPQVKLMRWDNDVNFSARLVTDGATAEAFGLSNDVVSWDKGATAANFYQLSPSEEYPEGAYEFDITLKEKPKSNVISFTLQTKGLNYFYQPELTQEEKDDGAFRPDNIIGSYAVYYKDCPLNYEGGKEYKSGKAFHVYRPRVEDAKGNWIWGELDINEKELLMTVTIPEKFLDEAVYPIRHAAGLTVGYTSLGGTNTYISNAGTFIYATKTAAASGGGTMSKIQQALWVANGNQHAKLAVYNDTAGAPSGLVENSYSGDLTVTRTTKPTADSHWTSSTNVSGTLVDGSVYWLAFSASSAAGNNVYFCYDTSAAASRYKGTQTWDNFPPANFPASPGNWDFIVSIYATYTAASTPTLHLLSLLGVGK